MARDWPRGRLTSVLLAGAWRESPPPLAMSEGELDTIASLLLQSGSAGLAWHRLRRSPLRASSAAKALHRGCLEQSLQAAEHEAKIPQIVELLRSAGVEPIVMKGWAIARRYPDAALRPYGDCDVYVAPEQVERAGRVLASPAGREFWVDLHGKIDGLEDLDAPAIRSRSWLLPLGSTDVRVLADEEHLRLLCMHLLKHGAWRPLWLCDVALMLESLSSEFDWSRCLGPDRRRAGAIACVLGLAHRLLGASLERVPACVREKQVPRWLVAAVVAGWEHPRGNDHVLPPLCWTPAAPRVLLAAMRRRWPPNPIEATTALNGSFNDWPRLPFQLAYMVRRVFVKLMRNRQLSLRGG